MTHHLSETEIPTQSTIRRFIGDMKRDIKPPMPKLTPAKPSAPKPPSPKSHLKHINNPKLGEIPFYPRLGKHDPKQPIQFWPPSTSRPKIGQTFREFLNK